MSSLILSRTRSTHQLSPPSPQSLPTRPVSKPLFLFFRSSTVVLPSAGIETPHWITWRSCHHQLVLWLAEVHVSLRCPRVRVHFHSACSCATRRKPLLFILLGPGEADRAEPWRDTQHVHSSLNDPPFTDWSSAAFQTNWVCALDCRDSSTFQSLSSVTQADSKVKLAVTLLSFQPNNDELLCHFHINTPWIGISLISIQAVYLSRPLCKNK